MQDGGAAADQPLLSSGNFSSRNHDNSNNGSGASGSCSTKSLSSDLTCLPCSFVMHRSTNSFTDVLHLIHAARYNLKNIAQVIASIIIIIIILSFNTALCRVHSLSSPLTCCSCIMDYFPFFLLQCLTFYVYWLFLLQSLLLLSYIVLPTPYQILEGYHLLWLSFVIIPLQSASLLFATKQNNLMTLMAGE